MLAIKLGTHSAVAQQWTVRLLLVGHLHGSEVSRCIGLTILLAALCIICGCKPCIARLFETTRRLLVRASTDPYTNCLLGITYRRKSSSESSQGAVMLSPTILLLHVSSAWLHVWALGSALASEENVMCDALACGTDGANRPTLTYCMVQNTVRVCIASNGCTNVHMQPAKRFAKYTSKQHFCT
jgi:hypothetical protein